ncbi:DUF1285 domain-containing protein [Acuticoccus sp. I52.16.1]|uniref:DUF1285 domain-containing protein n=1 Tax=Acuticoccus sp. I52.16.1 TaxID=2928472 RepID=UPI00352E6C7A
MDPTARHDGSAYREGPAEGTPPGEPAPRGDPARAPADPAAGTGGPLAALIARASELGGGAAPVHKWNPEHCGPIPMRIAADGTWFYNGTPILRDRLVRLFASILRREADGEFVLVTPIEKVGIEVEDAPFQAVELVVEGEGEDAGLTVRTNMGDVVTVGREHPLRVRLDPRNDGFIPYVRVRGALDARFTRPAAMELAELATARDDGSLVVWSGGITFPLGDRH